MAMNENLPPNVIKQLAKELRSLDESPPEGITVGVNDDDFSTIFADIEGPAETPYENGVFRMKLLLSNDFPHSPPKGYFLTKIFHPNIATNESALNEQAGKMLLENYEEYARHARLYTGIHAKPRHKFKSGAISVSNNTPKLDQSHVTVIGADQKNSAASTVPSVPSPLTSSTTITNIGNSQDQPSLVPPKIEKSILGSTAAAAGGPMRKESGLAKVHADRKKTDARKKSLKRL